MTEAEWLTSTDPEPMLDFLEATASGRKLRLFACACCRRFWRCLNDARSRDAIEVAERLADGAATVGEREAAAESSWEATKGLLNAAMYSAQAVHWTLNESPSFAASEAARDIESASVCDPDDPEEEPAAQAGLLRDIFGNPFRPTAVDRARRTPTVVSAAQTIYDERTFERMPGLAHALEAACCNNSDILLHCRGPGPHVRGCWVVDLILGKE
jgi:hypothetical protein